MDILDKPGLLSWKIVKLRNYNETKKNVDEIMYKVEEFRYTLSNIQPPRITPLYEIKYDFQKEYNNTNMLLKLLIWKSKQIISIKNYRLC